MKIWCGYLPPNCWSGDENDRIKEKEFGAGVKIKRKQKLRDMENEKHSTEMGVFLYDKTLVEIISKGLV